MRPAPATQRQPSGTARPRALGRPPFPYSAPPCVRPRGVESGTSVSHLLLPRPLGCAPRAPTIAWTGAESRGPGARRAPLAHKPLCSPELLPPARESRELSGVTTRDPSSTECVSSLSTLFFSRGNGLEVLYAHCLINKTLREGELHIVTYTPVCG